MSRLRVALLTAFYIVGYGWLRVGGEIMHVRPLADAPDGRHYIGAGWDMPRWRQQLYRALYAPLMVAEEEARLHGAGKRPQPRDRVAGFGREAPWNPSASEWSSPPTREGDGLPWADQGPEPREAVYYFAPVSGMVPASALARGRGPGPAGPAEPAESTE